MANPEIRGERGQAEAVDGAVERIGTLDLSKIHMNLTDANEGPGWTEEKCREVEADYKLMLLAATVAPDVVFAPSKDVDTFWHYHILDTRRYADDCVQVSGGMIHHDPYLGMEGESSARDLHDAWLRTQAIAHELGLTPEHMQRLGFSSERSNPEGSAFCGMVSVAAFCGMSQEGAVAFCGMQVDELETAAFCGMQAEGTLVA